MPEDEEYLQAAQEADEALMSHSDFMRQYALLQEAISLPHRDVWKLFQLAFYVGAGYGVKTIREGLEDQ
jgi:hypothetical protein